MPKKVIDIFPPKSAGSSRENQELFDESRFEERPAREKKRPERRFVSSKPSVIKGIIGATLLFLTLALAALHFFFSEARIKIIPATEVFSTEDRFTLDVNAKSSDFNSKVIPAKIFETENAVLEEFSAGGKVLKKSEGVIRLYNSYTTQTEIWLEGTRFVSSEGKLFLSKDRIRVPGAAIKNGKIEPSFADVPVIAREGGKEYNLGPSNFSIPAFGGTQRFTKYYGESLKEMSGGGEFPQVTKDDLQRAEAALVEKAKADSDAKIRDKIPETFVFLPQAVKTDILEKSSSAPEGAETGKFTFQVKTKSSAISFEIKDLEALANSLILSQIPANKKLHKESLKIEYQPETTNMTPERQVLSLKVRAVIYPKIDLDSLKKGMAGKSLQEAGILLNNLPELRTSEIKVFPFWLSSLPNELGKINIELEVE